MPNLLQHYVCRPFVAIAMKKSVFTRQLVLVLLASVVLLGSPGMLLGQEAADRLLATPSWTRGYTLIMLDAESLDAAYEAVDFIQGAGGRVAIIASPRVLLGWVPRALDRALLGQQGVRPSTGPRSSLSGLDEEEAEAVDFFAQVASGQWDQQKQALSPGPEFPGPDALRGACGLTC